MALMTVAVLYPPAQSLYGAMRLRDYHAEQLAELSASNAELQGRAQSLLTAEGIQDEARSKYGLVLPGETLVKVTGAGSTASDARDGSSDEASSEGASWATTLLDAVFQVDDPNRATDETSMPEVIEKIAPSAVVSEQPAQAQEDAAAADGATGDAASDAAAATDAAATETATDAETAAAQQ